MVKGVLRLPSYVVTVDGPDGLSPATITASAERADARIAARVRRYVTLRMWTRRFVWIIRTVSFSGVSAGRKGDWRSVPFAETLNRSTALAAPKAKGQKKS